MRGFPAFTARIARDILAIVLVVTPLAATVHAKDPGQKKPPAQAGAVDAAGIYQLSDEEKGYDCKRLAGRMQIRLLEARSYDPTKKASAVARTMQSVTEPVVGVMLGKASGYSADPDKRHRDDIAMLKAYNAALAAKGCRTYDLDKELGRKTGLPAAERPAATPPSAPAGK